MDRIPVVDIGALLNTPTEDAWKAIAEDVDHVLSSIGFIYLKNHGVPQNIVENAFAKSFHFYSLPAETKMKHGKVLPKEYGYVEPNREFLDFGKYKSEIRECFDLSLSVMHELNGTEIPESPDFVASLNELALACHPLIKNLHKILARALKLDDVEFFNKVSRSFEDRKVESYTGIRSLYYPPIPKDVEAGSIRLSQHSDYGTLTLLFQDAIGGLEVQRADGVWVPATPVPGTILVNTGDLLKFWSGGRYPSTVHRVLIPEIETKKRIWRQSIAYFVGPDNETVVSPIGDGTATEGSTSITAGEHAKAQVAKTYKF